MDDVYIKNLVLREDYFSMKDSKVTIFNMNVENLIDLAEPQYLINLRKSNLTIFKFIFNSSKLGFLY